MQYADLSKIKSDVVNDSIKIPEIELKKTGEIVEFKDKKKIENSDDAVKLFKDIWNKDLINAQEETYIIFFNNNNKPIGYYHHSTGGVNQTIQDVEIISAMAVKSLSKGVIVAHNHPSGNLKPSPADITVSKKLKEALRLFDILLLDQIIITEKGSYSLADNGDM